MTEVEKHLEGRQFLLDEFTAADICLFNTLVRMDEVYVCYFKCVTCSILRGNFPNLLRYTARVYHYGNIKECVYMDDIMKHYFSSHMVRNMFAVVPKSVNFLQTLKDVALEEYSAMVSERQRTGQGPSLELFNKMLRVIRVC